MIKAKSAESLVSHTITIQHFDGEGNNSRLYRMINGNWQEMVMVPRWVDARLDDIPAQVVDKFKRLAKAMEDIL